MFRARRATRVFDAKSNCVGVGDSSVPSAVKTIFCRGSRVGCDSQNLSQAKRPFDCRSGQALPPQQFPFRKKNAPGGFLLPALISLEAESGVTSYRPKTGCSCRLSG